MSEPAYRRWICDACGYIYDEARGDPDSGLAPGTRYEAIAEDWQCPLCGLTKADLRPLPEAPVAVAAAPRRGPRPAAGALCRGGDDYVVIVGAGIAGWSVAESIRRHDRETPILLISACEGLSYPKPALSTALAQGKSADDLIEQDAVTRAAALGLAVRTETRVIKIDVTKRRLTTSKGGIQYATLILALGAHQRQLPISGDAADSVLRVNDLAAYKKLRQRLDGKARHVTILGAGLIGCEFAEDLTSAGYPVSVIDPAARPLASMLPVDLAEGLEYRLKEKGVDWHLNVTLDSAERSGERLRAVLSDGEAIETDLILSAAGLVANTQLAEKAGLRVGRGIATDRHMRTSQAHIYTIGDCAEVEGEIYGYIEPIRRQAETIAADLRGASLPFEPLPPLVRVKTPSFPLTICGPLKGDDPAIIPQAHAEPGRVDYLQSGRLVGFVLSGNSAANATTVYQELFA
jgi:rubredoxin---NAD+ reductase